jgi:hypothetical protein
MTPSPPEPGAGPPGEGAEPAPTEPEPSGLPARGRGDRFREGDDAQQQLEEIEEAQRKVRQGKIRKVIDSIEKSEQRLKNQFKGVRRREDLEE